MPAHRRQFSPQFKVEAAQMVLPTGKSIAEVTRDLGDSRRDPGELGERLEAGAPRARSAGIRGEA